MNLRSFTNSKLQCEINKKTTLHFLQNLQNQVIFSEEQLFEYLNESQNKELSLIIENDPGYQEWIKDKI